MEPGEQPYGRQLDGSYNPSPAEICQHCAQIRSGWPPGEERRRRQWSVDREEIEVPEASCDELGLDRR